MMANVKKTFIMAPLRVQFYKKTETPLPSELMYFQKLKELISQMADDSQ